MSEAIATCGRQEYFVDLIRVVNGNFKLRVLPKPGIPKEKNNYSENWCL